MAIADDIAPSSRSRRNIRQVLRGIFWGARTSAITGQSIVSDHVLKESRDVSWIDKRYAARGVWAVLSAVSQIVSTYISVGFSRVDFIYVVCSRSTAGFLRDLPVLALSLLGVNTIVHVHGSDITTLLNRRMTGRLARQIYRRCDIIIPSVHLKADLQQLGCQSVHVVENFAVNLQQQTVSSSPPSEETSILWNSNIMASKGIVELVEGADIARRRGFDITLTIIGKMIPDQEATSDELKRFMSGLKDKSWINILGPVSHKRSIELLRLCDIVALPSSYSSECQPLAIIQAMCLAKSIIVNDTPALRATIGNYPAIRTDRQANALADALETCILQAETLKTAQTAAAANAIERFSLAKFDRTMSHIFQRAKADAWQAG